MHSMAVYLCLDSSLYITLCSVFGDKETAKGEEETVPTMLKHVKKYYIKDRFKTGHCWLWIRVAEHGCSRRTSELI